MLQLLRASRRAASRLLDSRALAAAPALLGATRQQSNAPRFDEERQEALSGSPAGQMPAALPAARSPPHAGPAGAGEPGELRFASLSPAEFEAVADIEMGKLWTQIERGLREAQGEAFDYEVRPERGSMLRVFLPFDGHLDIRKDAERRALVVESNLFQPFEDRDCREFRPVSETEWDDEDGTALPQFVGEALGQYLKAEVRL